MWEHSGARSPWRPPMAVMTLLALTSTTSALSLANFQIITSNAIPSPCIVAYNAQIAGCTQTDFTNGNQCSTLCISGLRAEATIVQAICGGLDVNAKSLLGLVLDGNILETLCPGADSDTTTVQVTVTTTSSKSTASTTSAQTFTTTTTSSAIDTTTSTSTSEQSTSSTAIINVPSSVSSTTETTIISTTTAASQTTQATSTSSSATSTSTTSDTSPLKGGGGSPFDAVVQSRATGLALPAIGILAPLLGAAMLLM